MRQSNRCGPQNSRLNCLAPGCADSPEVAKRGELAAAERIGTMREQAGAAALLLIDDKSDATGQPPRDDGGLTLSV